ncbi:MAG TPA: B12-binding domain-containing radical SAM protein [Candidatus Mediterraneibacter pullicola]|uniref:B12-binding domain-containing radical SAM protein n=2 Tax=Mediterraneibacter TaxID=2316020 RepID=A0A9D2KI17_9FIRM|nr:B12-binding domain-containing radical SAM protein [Candidatus Mediterraneibacter caccavium]HJA06359.1 B12-binding domain-containing radical SAM protein [Candidatus Mediterraneibacter pullicola]
MKVLLAAVNAKYIHSNLAVYSLRAYALQRCDGICPREIEIAEYTINQPPDEILMDIYGHQPDILCLSCYLWNIISVENLVREIPKILPGIRIWLGGPEVSYNAREMLDKYPEITGIIRGEGEETFADLMDIYHRQPDKKENFSEVKGITYWDEEGKVVETPPQDVMDLSRIPFVYEHIEDFRNRIIYYESSRGCPFSCSYCLSSIDKCLRFRDLRLVEKEVKFFIDHGVPQVKFVDRTFNCRHDHAMAVWTYIKKYDRGITNFHFEVAADLLNDEEIELIRSMRPGLIQLEIGVQSANERTIREIQRTMKLDQVRDRVARIKEMKNVHQHLDLIAGLPYEGYDSFARSFDIVYDMEPEQLQLGFLKVLKGALMHDKAEEYQLLYQDRPPYEVLSTKWLSYGELIRLKQIEEMVEVYYNSGQFRNTIKHLRKEFSSPFAMYEALAAYYRENGLFGRQYSRIARYEILHHFIEVGKQQEYLEWLTLDLYLRDNVKNRPPFLGENKVTKEEASAFYRAEASERRYLKGYEGYDSRQMRKMTHLERIGGKLILFDYQRRDALIGDARICVIENF